MRPTYWLCALALFFVLPLDSKADILIQARNSVVTPGGASTFEVELTNSTNADITVGGFQFRLSVPGPSGIQFTAATINTSSPYIFAGVSSTPPFSNDSFPNTNFLASDASFPVAGVTVAKGTTVGLGHILYSASNSFTGPTIVTVVTGTSLDTLLFDDLGNNITFTPGNGTIRSNGSPNPAVPEPATFTLLCGAGVALLVGRRVMK